MHKPRYMSAIRTCMAAVGDRQTGLLRAREWEMFRGSDMARGFAVYQPAEPHGPPAEIPMLGLYVELEPTLASYGVPLDLTVESLAAIDILIVDRTWLCENELVTQLAIYLGDVLCSVYKSPYWIVNTNGYPHVYVPPGTEWDAIYYVKHRAPQRRAFLVPAIEHFGPPE